MGINFMYSFKPCQIPWQFFFHNYPEHLVKKHIYIYGGLTFDKDDCVTSFNIVGVNCEIFAISVSNS